MCSESISNPWSPRRNSKPKPMSCSLRCELMRNSSTTVCSPVRSRASTPVSRSADSLTLRTHPADTAACRNDRVRSAPQERSPAQRMAELGIALEDQKASASDEALILEPLLSDVLGHLAVGVDAAVELHHHLIGQLLRDRIHDLGDLRVLI